MFSRVFAGALLLAVPAAPALADVDRAYGRDCWDRDEVAAARLQHFKTMLLVGALHCRDVDPYIMADYNVFLRDKRGFINASTQVLRDRFVRKFGTTYGLTAYSDYETALGNRLARIDYDRYRCETIGNYARLASDVSEAGLMDLAYSTAQGDELAICTPGMRYAGGRWSNREVSSALPPSPPPPAPLTVDAAEVAAVGSPTPPLPAPPPVAEPPAAPVAVAAAEWPDLAPVEPESQPVAVDPNKAVEVASVEAAALPPAATVQPAVVESAPKANPTEALRAAIKSLTAAVEALEANQATPPTR